MYLKTAIEAAKTAGNILLENYGKLKKDQVSLKGARDFVTDIDTQSEKAILKVIQSQFPGHAILAEESGEQENPSAYQWIIDPLDGTVNYIHQFPLFSVSIAMAENNELKIGVIYDPLRDELFTAEKGKGSYLNGQPVSVNQSVPFEDAILATGFPFRIHDRLENYLKLFQSIFTQVAGIRRGGSAAIDLAYVACGRFDGFWEMGLSPWDIAAGLLLIEEAGGCVSGFDGKRESVLKGDLVCGGPSVHPKILQTIQPYL